jgi:hypothetical protein
MSVVSLGPGPFITCAMTHFIRQFQLQLCPEPGRTYTITRGRRGS